MTTREVTEPGEPVFEFAGVTKRFDDTIALSNVTLAARSPTLIGLVGKNGSGKTTLLRHIVGLQLPTSGSCRTLGCATPAMGAAEFSRIGVVHQQDRLLPWMKVRSAIRFVAAFYRSWDVDLERELIELLEIDVNARIHELSPGSWQKLALVLATGHHPSLLVLDEPLSDLDPVARHDVLTVLLDRFRLQDVTMVISSHQLHDIERIVDHVVCLDRGRVIADASLDDLRERYAEWIVVAREGALPARFAEGYVLQSQSDAARAKLIVESPAQHLVQFRETHRVEVVSRALSLEEIFILLTSRGREGAGAIDGVGAPSHAAVAMRGGGR